MYISSVRSAFVKVIALLVLSIPAHAFSQVLEPVTWSFDSKMKSDTEAELIFQASIDEHWHLYSQDIPMSPPATTFTFEERGKYERIGEVEESESIREYDPNFDMELKYFSGEATFTQRIRLLTDEPVVVRGSLEFMCCDDKQCLPPAEVEYTFFFNGATEADVPVASGEDGEGALFETGTPDAAAEQEGERVDISEERIEGRVITGDDSSLLIFFLLSFLAGLAAILTPCVFPMIPMTVTFFMHDSDKKARAKFQAIVYGVSIVLIYTVVGTIVAVTLGANFANWLSTHWIPNVFFFLVFMFFAASFLGMFEITLPNWMISRSDKQADKGGFSGAFFMAFTLVLVSFSCTGPIVGAILVKSATGQVLTPIVGMLGFSLAFALPFTLFAFFPSWLSSLPKSGGWLNSVKVVLGFIELALGLKFLSIADQTYHWGILDREVYLAFWIVIFTLMGFYLLGKLKFSHDSELPYIPVPRLLMAIITFTFVMYLVPGMWGAPLKALSGYLPPTSTHDFDINDIVRDNARIVQGSDVRPGICDNPKYHDFLHLPHGLEGYFDYEQGLACAKKLDKPVFIDFTGHGCVNCREMEANVWADPKVLTRLRNDYVIIALYVDDKTRLPESDWIRSTYDGKMKKTIGKKYADFQISRFNVNAQPFYVLMDPNEKMLIQPRAYDLDVDEFVEFLDRGLAEYERRKNRGDRTPG
ncbi:MAG: cytochrome c biogenesis protein CcdA [Bacteroidales bacterium]